MGNKLENVARHLRIVRTVSDVERAKIAACSVPPGSPPYRALQVRLAVEQERRKVEVLRTEVEGTRRLEGFLRSLRPLVQAHVRATTGARALAAKNRKVRDPDALVAVFQGLLAAGESVKAAELETAEEFRVDPRTVRRHVKKAAAAAKGGRL